MADAPFTRPLLAAIFAVIFLMLLASLYKERRVRRARMVAVSAALLFLLLVVFVSKTSPASLGTLLLNTRYRNNSSQYRLVYDPSTPHTAKGEAYRGLRYASLPIRLEGLPSGDRLSDVLVQFRLDAGSYRYDSPWRPGSLSSTGLRLMVPVTVLEHAGHGNTRMTVRLAAEEIAPSETRTSDIQDRFSIPGGGACTANNPPYEHHSAATAIVCRFAYGVAQPVELQAHFPSGCPVAPPPPVHVPAFEAGLSMDPLTHWPIGPVAGQAPVPYSRSPPLPTARSAVSAPP